MQMFTVEVHVAVVGAEYALFFFFLRRLEFCIVVCVLIADIKSVGIEGMTVGEY